MDKKLKVPDDYKEIVHVFKSKDSIHKNPELLKEPMDELYKKVEGMDIWDGFIDCIDLYPEGDYNEYKLVAWVK